MLSLNEEESQILARKLADIKRACLEIKESASGLSIYIMANNQWQGQINDHRHIAINTSQ